jgi:hypothetical protein
VELVTAFMSCDKGGRTVASWLSNLRARIAKVLPLECPRDSRGSNRTGVHSDRGIAGQRSAGKSCAGIQRD